MFILSQGLLILSCPASEKAGVAGGVAKGHSQDTWLQVAKGILHTVQHYVHNIKLGGKLTCQKLDIAFLKYSDKA